MHLSKSLHQTLIKQAIFPDGQFDIQALAGDASNRQYFRLCMQPNKQSYILVFYPQQEGGAEIGGAAGRNSAKDFLEVQRLLDGQGIRVPKLIHEVIPDQLLVLEDLGDTVLLNTVFNQVALQSKLYSKALEHLKKIAQLRSKPDFEHSIVSQRTFTSELLLSEFFHFTDCAVEKALAYPKAAEYESLKLIFRELAAQISSFPKIPTHRDFHSRNLMVLPHDDLALIDFQDALMGPFVYDLASLLRDSYIEIDPKVAQACLSNYYEFLRDEKLISGLSRAGYQYAYRLTALQRNLKAAGRFFHIQQSKGNSSYLADVAPTLSYVKKDVAELDVFRDIRSYLTDLLDQVTHRAQELSCKP